MKHWVGLHCAIKKPAFSFWGESKQDTPLWLGGSSSKRRCGWNKALWSPYDICSEDSMRKFVSSGSERAWGNKNFSREKCEGGKKRKNKLLSKRQENEGLIRQGVLCFHVKSFNCRE